MSLPPHAGLLRDDTVALRHIFGYAGDSSASCFAETRLGEACQTSSIRNVLLVAVDVDKFLGYRIIFDQPQIHIGVSTLDTRRLQHLPLNDDCLEQAIDSRQFVIGNTPYARRAGGRFIFGQSEAIALLDFKSKFDAIIQGRDYILVVHGGHADINLLESLDIRPTHTIDTVKAAQFPLQLHYRYSLEKLLGHFSIPYRNLHAAGNDAQFTLRALLMIAVKDAERLSAHSSHAGLLEALESIARSPLPPRPPKPEKEPKVTIADKRRARQERRALRHQGRALAPAGAQEVASHATDGNPGSLSAAARNNLFLDMCAEWELSVFLDAEPA